MFEYTWVIGHIGGLILVCSDSLSPPLLDVFVDMFLIRIVIGGAHTKQSLLAMKLNMTV